MPARVAPAYSEEGDLLLGDLLLPSHVSKQQWVNEASNEIDSHLGKRYLVPLNFTDDTREDYVAPHVQLTISRIANHLASGRLILAQAIGGEDVQLQAYGKYLVDQALSELALLQDVEGAEERPPEDAPEGPSIANEDTVSAVESYYNNFGREGVFAGVWRPYG